MAKKQLLPAPDKSGKPVWQNSRALYEKHIPAIVADVESRFEAPAGCKIAVSVRRGGVGYAAVPAEGSGKGASDDAFAE